ncbi:MAG TPA: NUDIX domain-containing protein [Candidatus Saccharibacteria bacterium]|jgi:8-oxo-dGTP diphosphatase|nr:NUDIX domain-containing protein [Candidatus Saccharibacteria bacterium]HMT55406.1 NUDIX domain-containing protein [Candidatus Saccharibacteria bacterium]
MNYEGPSAKPHDSGVAVAVFIERDGKFLMMRRAGSTGSGTWAIPGGAVEYMEHPDRAAERELYEETGIQYPRLEFIGYNSDAHVDDQLHYVTLLYKTSDFKNEPQIMEPHKCTEMGWYTLDELPQPLFHIVSQKLAEPGFINKLKK